MTAVPGSVLVLFVRICTQRDISMVAFMGSAAIFLGTGWDMGMSVVGVGALFFEDRIGGDLCQMIAVIGGMPFLTGSRRKRDLE
mmetsp:Transcript_25132/g.51123  ORF Transcript_25132/g.51123 Transcript_25132/m.51123 type:complete len:84 (+) Transcript_25132:580-831(+)